MRFPAVLPLLGIAASTLAACSGGSPGSAPLGSHATAPANTLPSTASSIKTGKVTATLLIPHAKTSKTKNGKTRAYVPPTAMGLIVEVLGGSGASQTSSITGYALTTSGVSPSCVPSTSNATAEQCTISFNAPATTASSADTFEIYAYDAAQTTGTLAAGYTPTGNLLGDVASEAVPGTQNPAGVVAGATNVLTFTLDPVATTAVVSANGTSSLAGPLVVSVPGTGGTASVAIDGYDADGNEVNQYLDGLGDDETYVDPLSVSTSSAEFVAATTSFPNATIDGETITYTPSAGDAPTSPTAAAFSGSFAVVASLQHGGFNGTTTDGPSATLVAIAPLYAYSPSATTTQAGFSTTVYAIAAATPSGQSFANYTLVATAQSVTNDCSTYHIGAAMAGASGTAQQAVFSVATTAEPASGTTCTLTLSDGESQTPIAFTATGAHAVIHIPSKAANVTPVQTATETVVPGAEYQFTVENPGDTLYCSMSFADYIAFGSTSGSEAPVNGADAGYGTSYVSANNYFEGEFGFATDAASSGDSLEIANEANDDNNGTDNVAVWCAEFANTSAYDMANGGTEFTPGSQSATATPTLPNSGILAITDGNETQSYTFPSGFTSEAALLENPSSLAVGLDNTSVGPPNPVTVTYGEGNGNAISTGVVFVPITPGGSPNYGVYARRNIPTAAVHKNARGLYVGMTPAALRAALGK